MHQEIMKSSLGRNHQFLGARAALPLEEEDRVGREKEKIIITHRNHRLESSIFFGAVSYIIETTSFFYWDCPYATKNLVSFHLYGFYVPCSHAG